MKKLKYKLIHFFEKIGIRKKKTLKDYILIYEIKDIEKYKKAISWLSFSEKMELKSYLLEKEQIRNSSRMDLKRKFQ